MHEYSRVYIEIYVIICKINCNIYSIICITDLVDFDIFLQ